MILAIDQGTTSCRAILFDRKGKTLAKAQKEFAQYFPNPGWVLHDAEEIWASQLEVIKSVMEAAGASPLDINGIGITNQRETAVIWDRRTGKPVYNAIVWQSRQTADICERLVKDGLAPYVAENTGLVIDPYFSATKVMWILENVPGVRARAEAGELLFGTMDSWILWNLTGEHKTDYSNASRTMLYNIRTLRWDDFLLEHMNIPKSMLPEVCDSCGIFGSTKPELFGGATIPVAGIAGDQQAALFGQCCFEPGMMKNTYGTGCFMLMNTGGEIIRSAHGLLSTIAWGMDGKVEYALEGSVFMGGATVQWLRDGLGLIKSSAESGELAERAVDNGGVYLVPAFTGLGAPYWDMAARGIITGLTRGAGREHIVRAGLESIAYQVHDVVRAMERDTGIGARSLRVDGGAAASDFLMQFQADILGIPVLRPLELEVTALGAAFLAGLAVGVWRDRTELSRLVQAERQFISAMSGEKRLANLRGWDDAVARSRTKA